jgi:hypothetical protein
MLRFTIRDLLWLTLLAAVLVAWWVDRGRLCARIDWLENKDLWPVFYEGQFTSQSRGNFPSFHPTAPAPNPPSE